MRSGRPRAMLYLVLAALVLAPSAWAGQDWSAWLIVGSFAATGLILVWQRPSEVVGWILLGVAFAFSAIGSSLAGSASQVVDGRGDLGVTLYAWLSAWSASLFFGLFVALAVLFPGGRFPAGWIGVAGRIAVAIPLAFSAILAFAPTWTITFRDETAADVLLPLAVMPDSPIWPVLGDLVYYGVLMALVIAVGTLIVRFRRARGVERAQFKWLLAALAATVSAVVFAFLVMAFVDTTGTWMWWPAVIAYPTIPVAIGIAIRRYHLYDIDRIVSRSVSYLVVTGLIAAAFGGLVVALQAVLSGITQGGTLAVAASTLTAFAMFQPLRRRVQRVVDRRFDRARYDAERTAAVFAERLRDRVDLGGLHTDIAATVGEALRPSSTGLWIKGGPGVRQ